MSILRRKTEQPTEVYVGITGRGAEVTEESLVKTL